MAASSSTRKWWTTVHRERITFTRGRAYKKNDQCYVEQKNGSIVRALVGYDRFEGESAYRQLSRAVSRGPPLCQWLPAVHEAADQTPRGQQGDPHLS